jgi:hypothetical protein
VPTLPCLQDAFQTVVNNLRHEIAVVSLTGDQAAKEQRDTIGVLEAAMRVRTDC